ncbi:MAG: hypothetical protein M1379_18045 [Firmicutes bacterium]|nr:hypothetical protein [Bacillota bacterium]
MSTLQDDINMFFNWAEEQRQRINQLEDRRFRKILLISLLEMLASSAFPNKSVRERFISLIDGYSGWQDKDRISIPQLRIILLNPSQGVDEQEHQALFQAVSKEIDVWPFGRILRSDEVDPFWQTWPHFAKYIGCQDLIKKARYANLLWRFRNFIVHEGRSPGNSFEISSDNSTPYYLATDDLNGNTMWELTMPAEFISNIVKACASNLKKDYFEALKIDPYNSFTSKSNWFDGP